MPRLSNIQRIYLNGATCHRAYLGSSLLWDAPDFEDGFDRPSGEIGHDWNDFSRRPGAHLDKAAVVNGGYGIGDGPYYGHSMIAHETPGDGDTEGYEVEIEWELKYFTDQVSPLVCAAPHDDESVGYRNQMGLVVTPDIGLNYPIYLCTAFNNPDTHNYAEDDNDNYTHFDFNYWVGPNASLVGNGSLAYDDSGAGYGTGLTQPTMTVTMRVKNNYVEAFMKGQRVAGPVPLPTWAQGRSLAGAQIIQARGNRDGQTRHPVANQKHIDKITIRPFSGELGSIPPAPTIPSSSLIVQESSSTTLTLSTPAASPGDLLYTVCYASTGIGAFAAPTGWYEVDHSGGVFHQSMTVLCRLVDGTEESTYDFVRSQSGELAGMMFAVRNANPTTFLDADKPGSCNRASSNVDGTPTTALESPTIAMNGTKRLVVWFSGCKGAGTITTPVGFTSLANTSGSTGSDTQLALAWRHRDAPAEGSYAGGPDQQFSADGSVSEEARHSTGLLAVYRDPR